VPIQNCGSPTLPLLPLPLPLLLPLFLPLLVPLLLGAPWQGV